MSLYIGGAQCKHAEFHNNEDWEIFDKLNTEMQKLATQFNVVINRYNLNEDNISYVISNKEINHECFYESAAFNYNMTIESSPDFDNRANNFIEALNENVDFNSFHNLNWSDTQHLYFVIS